MLHAVDAATPYPERMPITTRKLDVILRGLDNTWFLRHGCQGEVRGDQVFEKPILQAWMQQRGSKFVPLPSSSHSKAGIVERKNRVVKDALEKLDQNPHYAGGDLRTSSHLLSS